MDALGSFSMGGHSSGVHNHYLTSEVIEYEAGRSTTLFKSLVLVTIISRRA